MRRLLGIAILGATTASIACSLVYRSSDYFDPNDQLTTIGTAQGGAVTIALTTSSVVYATTTAIVVLPKGGGDPQELRTLHYGALKSLASNDVDTVAWCGEMGIQAWHPGGAIVTIDPTPECVSVDVRGSTLAAAIADGGDASAYSVRLYEGASFVPSSTLPLPAPTSVGDRRVSVTSPVGVYFVDGQFIGRRLRPNDPKIYTLLGSCPLALGATKTLDFHVSALADGGTLVFYRANNFSSFSANDECCNFLDGGCPRGNAFLSDADRAIVVRDPWVYYLRDNELRRSSITAALGQGPPPTTVVRSGFGSVVGSLAVDATHAYFGVGDRIERVALP